MKKLNDEILADFIGVRVKNSSISQQWSFIFCDGYYPSISLMKFHKSWDWLKPIIDKIWKLRYESDLSKIERTRAEIDDQFGKILNTPIWADIRQVYKDCLTFVKWYNSVSDGSN